MIEPHKDLLQIEDLSKEEIESILAAAQPFKELFKRSVKKVPTLQGKTVLSLFYEPSTRTSSSFEVAANRLSADFTSLAVASSSVVKGESVLDTVDTLGAMKADYIIIRHKKAGIPNLIASHTDASVINAGDGFHAHPTQALLDASTLYDAFGTLEFKEKKILIVGDILHSRVARSTSRILSMLGAEVRVLGPGTLVPPGRPKKMKNFQNYKDAMEWCPDVIYLLRVQFERQGEQFFPSSNEYHSVYGLTEDRLKTVKEKGIWVMHPGPVNRGVEISDSVMNYERCLINKQVENGIATRMAVLYWLKPKTLPSDE
ncbi:MAG: aspartate carbamoyltransferase [Verrucomicrobiaceae bacterium]|nr:aspartate carbamoyltransferase [Verrucomicrobiaceae bacterium]|tara:strand:+ start:3169 stop:4113 length:945 start_codon:yes stop_codon:yes gene_type:complete